MPKKFSLGAAVLSALPAEGYEGPEDSESPSAWLAQLVGMKGVLPPLFKASKAVRRFVLRSAPTATLTLHVTEKAPRSRSRSSRHGKSSGWAQQLAAAADALAVRGDMPTRITVICCRGVDREQLLLMIPSALQAVGSGVTELDLQHEDGTVQVSPTTANQFLTQAAVSFPNLHKLTIDCCCILPSPAAMPQVRHMHFNEYDTIGSELDTVIQPFYDSLGPYMAQLESLFIIQVFNDEYWHRVFRPAGIAHHLESLTVGWPLTGPAVRLLLDQAPALRELTVGYLSLQGQDFSGERWAVERVSLQWETAAAWDKVGVLRLEDVAGLPRRAEGRCIVDHYDTLTIHLQDTQVRGACIA